MHKWEEEFLWIIWEEVIIWGELAFWRVTQTGWESVAGQQVQGIVYFIISTLSFLLTVQHWGFFLTFCHNFRRNPAGTCDRFHSWTSWQSICYCLRCTYICLASYWNSGNPFKTCYSLALGHIPNNPKENCMPAESFCCSHQHFATRLWFPHVSFQAFGLF